MKYQLKEIGNEIFIVENFSPKIDLYPIAQSAGDQQKSNKLY